MKEIFTVWKKELIDNFRDRRTLMTAILMPVILIPIILIGTFKLQESQVKQAEEKKAVVAINSVEVAPSLVDFLQSQESIEIKDNISDYQQAIDDEIINVFIEVTADFENLYASQKTVPVKLYSKSSSNIDSSMAIAKVTSVFNILNQANSLTRLSERGVDPQVLQSISVESIDLSTAEEKGGFIIGLLLPMFIVMFAIVGGMYIAIDVSAGEKERKTLEALLFTPISRFKLVMGKYMAVSSMAILTIILSLLSMVISFKVYPPSLIPGEQLIIDLSVGAVIIMLGLGIILAIMFSGLLLSVAIFAKSYKEAQNYISPFYILAVLPVALANSLPGLKPTFVFYLIPGMNAVFVIKEALLGTFNSMHIITTIGSLLIFALLGIIIASQIYSKEGILFRD